MLSLFRVVKKVRKEYTTDDTLLRIRIKKSRVERENLRERERIFRSQRPKSEKEKRRSRRRELVCKKHKKIIICHRKLHTIMKRGGGGGGGKAALTLVEKVPLVSSNRDDDNDDDDDDDDDDKNIKLRKHMHFPYDSYNVQKTIRKSCFRTEPVPSLPPPI